MQGLLEQTTMHRGVVGGALWAVTAWPSIMYDRVVCGVGGMVGGGGVYGRVVCGNGVVGGRVVGGKVIGGMTEWCAAAALWVAEWWEAR